MAALVRHDIISMIRCARPRIAGRAQLATADAAEIQRLYDALDHVNEADHPRTARLLAGGRGKMAQKLIEEAAEVSLAAARHHNRGVVRESADLLYQLIVLWRDCGIAPEEVWAEMHDRAERFGIAAKLPKARDCEAPDTRMSR